MRLNQLRSLLEPLTYPLSVAELANTLDGETIDYPAGDEPLAAVLERAGTDTMTSVDDAWLSVLSNVDEAAIGRKGYTDRDPPCNPDEFEPISL